MVYRLGSCSGVWFLGLILSCPLSLACSLPPGGRKASAWVSNAGGGRGISQALRMKNREGRALPPHCCITPASPSSSWSSCSRSYTVLRFYFHLSLRPFSSSPLHVMFFTLIFFWGCLFFVVVLVCYSFSSPFPLFVVYFVVVLVVCLSWFLPLFFLCFYFAVFIYSDLLFVLFLLPCLQCNI